MCLTLTIPWCHQPFQVAIINALVNHIYLSLNVHIIIVTDVGVPYFISVSYNVTASFCDKGLRNGSGILLLNPPDFTAAVKLLSQVIHFQYCFHSCCTLIYLFIHLFSTLCSWTSWNLSTATMVDTTQKYS